MRFTDRVSEHNYVRVMTDGILLAETQGDRFLNAYDTIIIDEAHERSLNIDFLLGYIKRLLPRRPELKVIVTSATIDAERFSKHFDDAPVIEVSGRLYPVDVRYRPLEEDDEDRAKTPELSEAIVDAVDEVSRASAPTATCSCSCRASARFARPPKHCASTIPRTPRSCRCSRGLSCEEQERVFKPSGARRIVLATNVAETSLTVPGITLRDRHGPRARQPLQLAQQGGAAADREDLARVGQPARRPLRPRDAPGVCVRLYQRRGLREPRPSSPIPRSCARRSPRSSCA